MEDGEADMSYINEQLEVKSKKELAKLRGNIQMAIDFERRFLRSALVKGLGRELRMVEYEMRKRFQQERKAAI